MLFRPLCVVAAAAFSSTSLASDLLETYSLALENDAHYQAARYQRQSVGQQTAIARSTYRPSIRLGAGADRLREELDGSGVNGSDSYNTENLAVSLSQSLYNRQDRVLISQSALSDQQAGIDLEAAEDGLILRLATSYFLVLGARDNVDLAVSEKTAIKRQMELADERLNVGIGTQTDLYDAQARFQIAEANEIEAGNFLEDARQSLIQIIGQQPSELSTLRENAPLEMPKPAFVEDWISLAFENNPGLRSDSLDLEIARQEVDKQKFARHPNISLDLSQNYSNSDGGVVGSGSDRETTVIGLNLTVPIYLGGLIGAQVKQAGLNANVSEQILEQTRRQVDRDVRDVFNDVTTGIKRVDALKQAVVAGESAVDSKNEGFAAGLITNLDVLDAQRDLYQAQRDYLRARYDFILSVLRLEQAAGQLDVEDVRRVNHWLS